MANKEISELTTVTLPMDGTEQAHFKQGANSREVNMDEIADFVGRGSPAIGLGFAKFSAPGDVFTAYNSATPVQNAFDATTGHWVIEHNTDDGLSCAVDTVSAGDFDIVFALSCFGWEDTAASAALQWGVIVSDGVDSTTVAAVDTGLTFEKNFRDTDRLTYVSTNATKTIDGRGAFPIDQTQYWRVTRVGSATTFYISPNGFDWIEIATGTDTENNMSSILEVGVFLGSVNATQTEPIFLRAVGYDTDGPQPEARSGGGTFPVSFKGFRAHNGASTQGPITATTITEVTLGTEVFDTEAAFASNRFTVPGELDGKYGGFVGGVHFQAAADAYVAIQVSTDSGSTWDFISRSGADSATNLGYLSTATGPVLLNEDDIYRLVVYAQAAETIEANNTEEGTFFSGFVIETSEDAFDYVEDTGTARTLTAADFKGNRTLECTNAGAITLTLNTGVGPAGPLTVIQGGAGAITVSGTATLESSGSLTSSGGQHTAFTIIPTQTTDVYKLVGTLA